MGCIPALRIPLIRLQLIRLCRATFGLSASLIPSDQSTLWSEWTLELSEVEAVRHECRVTVRMSAIPLYGNPSNQNDASQPSSPDEGPSPTNGSSNRPGIRP